VGDQVYFGGVNLRALLLFSLLVFGNTETEVARMFPIKGFADPDFHTSDSEYLTSMPTQAAACKTAQ
jgi:hypothetical protein